MCNVMRQKFELKVCGIFFYNRVMTLYDSKVPSSLWSTVTANSRLRLSTLSQLLESLGTSLVWLLDINVPRLSSSYEFLNGESVGFIIMYFYYNLASS